MLKVTNYIKMDVFTQKQNQHYTVPSFGTNTSTWFTPSVTPGNSVSTFGMKPTTTNWFTPTTTTISTPNPTTPSNQLFGKPGSSVPFEIKPIKTSNWSNSSTVVTSLWSKPFGITSLPSTDNKTLSDNKINTFFKAPVLTDSPSNGCCTPFSFKTSNPENIQTALYNVASNITLVNLNLPKNKMEGLIFMVCLDQNHTISSITHMLNNIFDVNTKFSIENLWFLSLIKYSDEKFLLNKVPENHLSFAILYSCLLRELMIEHIQTPEQLYVWLIDFAKNIKNKKMLWLFTILKKSGTTKFEDILDLTNGLEVFAVALQTFIQYDNNPTYVVKHALQSTNTIYKIFLLSLTGASYGKNCNITNYNITMDNSELDKLITNFK
jgi:hypothetical protein